MGEIQNKLLYFDNIKHRIETEFSNDMVLLSMVETLKQYVQNKTDENKRTCAMAIALAVHSLGITETLRPFENYVVTVEIWDFLSSKYTPKGGI